MVEILAQKSLNLETKLSSYRTKLYQLLTISLLGLLSACSSPLSGSPDRVNAIDALSATQTIQLAESTYSESVDIVPRSVRDATYRIITEHINLYNPFSKKNFVGTALTLENKVLNNKTNMVTMLVNRHMIEESGFKIKDISLDNRFNNSATGPAFCETYPGFPSADLALCSFVVGNQLLPTLGLDGLSPGATPRTNTPYIFYSHPYDDANPERLLPVANYALSDPNNVLLNPNPEISGEYDPNNTYWSFPQALSGGGGSGGTYIDSETNKVVAIHTTGSSSIDIGGQFSTLATPIPMDFIIWYQSFVQKSETFFNNQ